MIKTLIKTPMPPVKEWKENQTQDFAKLADFLSQAYVSEANMWKTEFGSYPPRQTVARICAKAQIPLDPTMEHVNYHNKKQFRKEARRILKWYSKPKRLHRYRKGQKLRGQKIAVTKKIKEHFRKLRGKREVAGLWHWRRANKWLRECGYKIHSGTLPVERLWSIMLGYLPQSVRQVSKKWFSLLCQISFLKYNWQFYAGQAFPAWSQRDAMMQQKIENCHELMQAIIQGEFGDYMLRLLKPFRP